MTSSANVIIHTTRAASLLRAAAAIKPLDNANTLEFTIRKSIFKNSSIYTYREPRTGESADIYICYLQRKDKPCVHIYIGAARKHNRRINNGSELVPFAAAAVLALYAISKIAWLPGYSENAESDFCSSSSSSDVTHSFVSSARAICLILRARRFRYKYYGPDSLNEREYFRFVFFKVLLYEKYLLRESRRACRESEGKNLIAMIERCQNSPSCT